MRYHLCGIPIDDVSLPDLLAAMEGLSAGNAPSYICYLNAHVHNLARRDPSLRSALEGAAICYADGAGIVWGGRVCGIPLPSRMTAADFFPEALRRMQALGRRVYFLGGQPGIAERCATAIQTQVPGFRPVGIRDGYFSDSEAISVMAAVRAAQPDLLVVGMGSPRQEIWIQRHLDALHVPLVWGVGALFDYSAGVERRCPTWMGTCGLEWLYRLAMQPHRMASRYLLGNPRFVAAVLRHRLGMS